MTSPSLPVTSPSRPGRIEWGLVLGIVVLGLVLRSVLPGRIAVEHFDEGIYASNLWFDAEQNFRYPARHLYAPPLVPWLLEWSQILFGPTNLGTMLVGIVSGTLTIVVLWWAVRAWFGIPAGLAAAVLAAMSDYHMIYSRTALTEPVLCLLLLLSVALLWRNAVGVLEGNSRWVLPAGIATGLCWSAKYNGWLPLAIGLAGLSGWGIFSKTASLKRARQFLMLAGVMLVAVLVVFPIWWDLQEVGGYRVVQENHARYLVGIAGWGDSFQRQLANHQFFDGPISWIGLGLAVILAGAGSRLGVENSARENSPRRNWLWLVAWTMILLALAVWLGTSLVLGTLGVLRLVLACPWRRRASTDSSGSNLAYWFIAAWFIGLFLATPLYTPYPRLSLPWLIAAWMMSSAMLGSRTGQDILFGRRPWQAGHDAIPAIVSLLGVAFLLGWAANLAAEGIRLPAAWEDRTGLEQSAEKIADQLESQYQNQAIVYVYAEPALFYHLRAKGLPMVAPVADLGFADRPSAVPTLLAVGPHARRSPEFQAEFQKRGGRFELLESYRFTPSPLVLLNHFPPRALRDPDFEREETIDLYRVKSR